RSREGGGIHPPLDVRYLGRGERDHPVGGVVAVDDVEVVKVPTGRAQNDDPPGRGAVGSGVALWHRVILSVPCRLQRPCISHRWTILLQGGWGGPSVFLCMGGEPGAGDTH